MLLFAFSLSSYSASALYTGLKYVVLFLFLGNLTPTFQSSAVGVPPVNLDAYL